ncbi:hypothetical protein O9K51_11370 [Purpureocillium lavendulum]|uniref:Uncharacterized protein n=1 Tax=Purpureocillium lavendulum TaxID=1247861 RepID=A0AB34FBB9_9HYPO|nr:hypothetical protein O9K51_11370 [Purpureocillium lavendulum]
MTSRSDPNYNESIHGDHDEIDWGSDTDELFGEDGHDGSNMAITVTGSSATRCEGGKPSDEPRRDLPGQVDLSGTTFQLRAAVTAKPDPIIRQCSTATPSTQKRVTQQPSLPRKRQCTSLPRRATAAKLRLRSGANLAFRRDVQSELWQDQTGHAWPIKSLMACLDDLAVQVEGRNGDSVELERNGSIWEGLGSESGRLLLDRHAVSNLLGGDDVLWAKEGANDAKSPC